MRDLEGRIQDRVVPDAAGVHVGFVGKVHKVVDHQPVVAFQAVEKVPPSPFHFVPIIPVKIGQSGRIGQRRIARPNPNQPVTLRDGIGSHAGRRIDCLLRGHVRAPTRGIEHEAVIAADDLIADEPAQR